MSSRSAISLTASTCSLARSQRVPSTGSNQRSTPQHEKCAQGEEHGVRRGRAGQEIAEIHERAGEGRETDERAQ
jgi:hypothetical protein